MAEGDPTAVFRARFDPSLRRRKYSPIPSVSQPVVPFSRRREPNCSDRFIQEIYSRRRRYAPLSLIDEINISIIW